MANEKQKRAARAEKLTLKRLMIANAVALAAFLLTVTIVLAALGLLPSIIAFFF